MNYNIFRVPTQVGLPSGIPTWCCCVRVNAGGGGLTVKGRSVGVECRALLVGDVWGCKLLS